ncbi:MAG: gliding motility-associated ABC transporter substrate-binding protein GldG [Bacteroidales bacterium]
MFAILKKELTQFFGSFTGYVVVIVFLLTSASFLWVFSGGYNVFEGGYATLTGYFNLAPWLFLFLIPAITMKLIAEEKKQRTLELQQIRPISNLNIVLAKYLSTIVLTALCIVPTLLYFFTVYKLGSDTGGIDIGATWGSYIGLIFLASIYASIGIFCSSLTDNQAIAFTLSIVLYFVIYLGLDFIGYMDVSASLKERIMTMGINSHYQSISRGVVDSRYIIYFLATTMLFILLTTCNLQNEKRLRRKWRKIIGIYSILFIIIISSFNIPIFRWDLTAEKRYSISEVSKDLIRSIDQNIYVDVFLDGEMPINMKMLQRAVKDKLDDYKAYSKSNIVVNFIDPYATQSFDNTLQDLNTYGIKAVNLNINKDDGFATQMIIPGALVTIGDRRIGINLLKQSQGMSADENLNYSIETLEYEFSSAINILKSDKKHNISFLEGYGEASEMETADFAQTLTDNNYTVEYVDINRVENYGKNIDVLIVNGPKDSMEEHDKFVIDQYLMKGGNIVYLLDPVRIDLDSLSQGHSTLAIPNDINLQDQLFRYGFRVNYNLLQDVECLKLPVNIAAKGETPNFAPASWHYSPLMSPSANSPISRNLGKVKGEFVSGIDTVGGAKGIRRHILMTSSSHARMINTPAIVSLSNIYKPSSETLFNMSFIPTAVLAEGIFTSAFKNRPIKQYGRLADSFKAESDSAKVVVIADGDFLLNKVAVSKDGRPQILPLGYDRYSKQTFANKDFGLNIIQYMTGNEDIMSLRGNALKLRLLNKVKVREQKIQWQMLNLIAPSLLMILFGMTFFFVRKWRYGK